jgi:hypothetical protein
MKKRNKKYTPKKVLKDPMSFIKTGLVIMPPNMKVNLQIKNHAAMLRLVEGTAVRDDWDLLVGAANMALIMSEMEIGMEYHEMLIKGRDALFNVGKRLVKWKKLELCGNEQSEISDLLEVHDAQLEISRVVDIERAAAAVLRRINLNINTKRAMTA